MTTYIPYTCVPSSTGPGLASSQYYRDEFPPETFAGTSDTSQNRPSDSRQFNGSSSQTQRVDTEPSLISSTQSQGHSKSRIIYATSLALVVVAWEVVNTIFTIRERNHETKYSTADIKEKGPMLQQMENQSNSNNNTLHLFLQGRLRGFSPDKSALTVDWEGLLLDSDLNDLHLGTPSARYNLAIFRDVPTERDIDTEKILNPNGTEPQIIQFRVFRPAPPPVGFIGRSPKDSISTDISVGEREHGSVFTQPNFAYPYDISQGHITFAMSKNDTVNAFNTSQGTFLVPIRGAVLKEALLNYQIDISSASTCSDVAPTGCQLDITLELQRPGLVKAVVILTVFINWLITLSICTLTGEAIILGREYILEQSDILSICLTSLFALPSVRSVLPGAPPFGCLIDTVGILPNIILISLCTTALAVAKAKKRRPEQSHKHAE